MAPKKNKKSKKKKFKKKYEKKRKKHTLIGRLKSKYHDWKRRREIKKKKYRVGEQQKSEALKEEEEEEKYKKNYYWSRAITGVITAILGVFVFHLVGWDMFIYFILFLVVFPFIISFGILRIPYKKGEWDWKNIMKKGVSPQFFLFMLISTICHTFVVVDDYEVYFDNPADTQGIALVDNNNIMLVADGENGLLSLNHSVGGYGHRNLLDKKEFNGSVNAIHLIDNISYIISDEEGLLLYNISNPNNLKLISSNSTFKNASHFLVQDNYMYISNSIYGLYVLDITNPAEPTQVFHYDTEGRVKSTNIVGNSLYVADGNKGILVFDNTNPLSPAFVNSFNVANDTYSIIVEDDTAYLAGGEDGVFKVNISDLANVQLIGKMYPTEEDKGDVRDVMWYNDSLYFLAGKAGLWKGDVFVNNSEDSIGYYSEVELVYNSRGEGLNMFMEDDTLFICDGGQGITYINIENPPPSPEPVSNRAKKISFGWMWIVYSFIGTLALIKIVKKRIKKKD